MITLNHNLMASSSANKLASHYESLRISTQRLSSGLRINGAADDAAGLAIRELMRADVAALNQGTRNANDAISMLQTFDGALGVIDEKLIRMKELAEQAATGTYDSTQRLMINSEFQAMASEINRIANATDFNGIKLLCTPMITKYRDVEKLNVINPGSLDNLNPATGITATLAGLDPNKYINKDNTAKTISVTLTAEDGTKTDTGPLNKVSSTTDPTGTVTRYNLGDSDFSATWISMSTEVNDPIVSYKNDAWTVTDTDVNATDPNNKTRTWTIQPINPGDNYISADYRRSGSPRLTVDFYLEDKNSGPVDFGNFAGDYPSITGMTVDIQNGSYSIDRKAVTLNKNDPNGELKTADYTARYDEKSQTIDVKFTNGGIATLKLNNPLTAGDTITFDINMEGETKIEQEPYQIPDPDQKVKIHFGTMNDSSEDYYYIQYTNCTTEGLGLDGVDVKTQDNAQGALVKINDAIVKKDEIRANYGALQNRFENTITNLRTQAENLQASESRISDTDVALEMTQFVRNQILTQSAVAMLAQANSMPQLVMRLIG